MQTTKIGRYIIEQHIGTGAYADVYRASDTILKRTVALKILKPVLMADRDAFARFLQEAQVGASLIHPRIAWVWDLGDADTHYFLAMRFIQGSSLDKIIREKGQLPWKEAQSIFFQVAEALDFAHANGLVHRDIKPQNIIISPSEGAVLTDFGLVRAMEASNSLTQTGLFLGTPQYMPPEVWKGQPAGPAADQYALACVLVEMLTGKRLFDAPVAPAIMMKHFEPVQMLETWVDGAPEGLSDCLRMAFASDPENRYPSIKKFMEAIQSLSYPEKIDPIISSKVAVETGDATIDDEHLNRIVRQPLPERKQRHDIRLENDRAFLILAPDVEMEFVHVKHGLEDFWIGRYPVTRLQYDAFVRATGHTDQSSDMMTPIIEQVSKGKIYPAILTPPDYEGKAFHDAFMEDVRNGLGAQNHPVTCVSKESIKQFCKWSRTMLPSFNQWSLAARGLDARKYPWGNNEPTNLLCNHLNNIGMTTPVGLYSPLGDSPFGCADMSGNVWELTKEGNFRGGSWNSPANLIMIDVVLDMQFAPSNFAGFRCVLPDLYA